PPVPVQDSPDVAFCRAVFAALKALCLVDAAAVVIQETASLGRDVARHTVRITEPDHRRQGKGRRRENCGNGEKPEPHYRLAPTLADSATSLPVKFRRRVTASSTWTPNC